MPNWKELITTDNIVEYLDEDTFVDVRYIAKGMTRGFWLRSMITCPYLKDEFAFGEAGLTSNINWLNFGAILSRSYIFGRDSIIGVGLTTGPTSNTEYNNSNRRVAGNVWSPVLNATGLQEAIYNPFAFENSSVGMRIVSSRAEVIYGSIAQYTLDFRARMGLSWGTFDHPYIEHTHQQLDLTGAPSISNDQYMQNSYIDRSNLQPIEVINESSQALSTHDLTNYSASMGNSSDWTNGTKKGFQMVNCKPSNLSGNTNDDIIGPDKALIPLLGNTLTPGESAFSQNYFLDSDTIDLTYISGNMNGNHYNGGMVSFDNFQIKLITILRRDT